MAGASRHSPCQRRGLRTPGSRPSPRRAAARSPVDAVIASRKIPLSAPIREGLGGGLAHSLPCQPPAHRSHPLAVEVFVEVDHTSPPQSQDVRSLVSVGLPVTRASPILPLHHYRGILR